MIKAIKGKMDSISKAVFRISKAYPASIYCSNLSVIVEQLKENIRELSVQPDQAIIEEPISCLMKKALHEVSCIREEGIVVPINGLVLYHNMKHLQSLIRKFMKQSHFLVEPKKIQMSSISDTLSLHNEHAPSQDGRIMHMPQKTELHGNVFTDRQDAILTLFASSKAPLQLKDIMLRFADVSDRTIRFDLALLVRTGRIVQRGFGRGSFYELKDTHHNLNVGNKE